MKQKIAVIGKQCVACGCCVKQCPRQALSIHHGITAVVDATQCVGCGRCAKACPASVITMSEREGC